MTSSTRRPTLIGVRTIAAEAGIDGRKIGILAREGYAQVILSLVMVEQGDDVGFSRRLFEIELHVSTQEAPRFGDELVLLDPRLHEWIPGLSAIKSNTGPVSLVMPPPTILGDETPLLSP